MHTSLVDYHCHLDLYPDFESLIKDCEQKQIYTVTVTTTPRAWPRNHALTKQLSYVKAALGLHPQLVTQYSAELRLWEQYLLEAKFIGEIGLDAGPAYYASFDLQKNIFEYIVKRCSEMGGKILTIHSVRAVAQVLDTIEKQQLLKRNKAVLHWFTGSLAEARRAIDMGCYFSVNLPMLSSNKGIELIKLIPKQVVLTETDGPFTMNNGKPQKPDNVELCIAKLSSLWRLSSQQTKAILFSNASYLESSIH